MTAALPPRQGRGFAIGSPALFFSTGRPRPNNLRGLEVGQKKDVTRTHSQDPASKHDEGLVVKARHTARPARNLTVGVEPRGRSAVGAGSGTPG